MTSRYIQRLLLRRYYALGGVLLTNLQTYAWARAGAVSAGVLQSVAGNGHSQSTAVSNESLSPEDLAESAEVLLTTYEAARAALVASGVAAPTDLQIYTEMLDRLGPITKSTSDFSQMREVLR